MGRRRGKSKADPSSSETNRPSFRTLSNFKRNQLNKLVFQLFEVTCNYSSEPSTTAQFLEEHETIRKILEQIIALESTNMARPLGGENTKRRMKRVADFMQWLKDCGAQISEKIRIEDFKDQGLGLLVVNDDIKFGEEVMSIPRKCMLTIESAMLSSVGPLIMNDPLLRSMENVALAIHLLIEKNSPASFWEPYINVLPSTFTTVLYFTPDEFEALRGTSAYFDALRQYKFVARHYAYFYRKFQATLLKDYFTYSEYRWAVSTVMTRQNRIPLETPDGVKTDREMSSLTPFWDLVNHAPGQISTDYNSLTKSTICLANRDFVFGEQFTIFYGIRSAADFLNHNGFVPVNCCESMLIRLGLGLRDPLREQKADLLKKWDIPSSGYFPVLGRPLAECAFRPFDLKTMMFLRVNCMNSRDEIETWMNKPPNLVEEKDFAHSSLKVVDLRVFQYAKTRCELLLKAYSPPITLTLEKCLSPEVAVSIGRLVTCEVCILESAIEFCNSAISHFGQQI